MTSIEREITMTTDHQLKQDVTAELNYGISELPKASASGMFYKPLWDGRPVPRTGLR